MCQLPNKGPLQVLPLESGIQGPHSVLGSPRPISAHLAQIPETPDYTPLPTHPRRPCPRTTAPSGAPSPLPGEPAAGQGKPVSSPFGNAPCKTPRISGSCFHHAQRGGGSLGFLSRNLDPASLMYIWGSPLPGPSTTLTAKCRLFCLNLAPEAPATASTSLTLNGSLGSAPGGGVTPSQQPPHAMASEVCPRACPAAGSSALWS